MGRTETATTWDKDFAEFLSAEDVSVPDALSRRLTARIRSELNPSPWTVFGKVALIQFLIGSASLLFCPQFGVAFTSSMGIMPYLMRFGDGVCMLGCGAVFTSLSLLVSSLVLPPEAVRVLKRGRILQLVSLATLSLGAFLCVGGEVVATLGLAWILGALLGGAATLELGWRIRRLAAAGSAP